LTLNSTTGPWNLDAGLITGGTITEVGGTFLEPTNAGGELMGVVLNGDLDMASTSVMLDISGGLTLNGPAFGGNNSGTTSSFMRFDGTQTLGGSGSVVFGSDGGGHNSLTVASGTLTLAPGFLVHGKNGAINGPFTNQGTIASDGGGAIVVNGATNYSKGTLTGGTWQAVQSSALDLIGDAITTNAA